MSDEILDLRARFIAEDRWTAEMQSMFNKAQRISKKFQNDFAKFKMPEFDVDEAVIHRLQKAGRSVDGLTDKYIRQANVLKSYDRLTAASFAAQDRIIRQRSARLGMGTKAAQRENERALANAIKLRSAMTYVWNQGYKHRLTAEEQVNNAIESIRDKAAKNEERRERDLHSARIRRNRQLYSTLRSAPGRMMNRLDGNGFFNSPAFYALAAGAGVGAAGRSATLEALSLDKSETAARINMDQSKVDARQLRDTWALPRGVALGQNPASLMMTAVDAAKAGVPEEIASQTAEMVTQLSKAFGIDANEAMEGMGYAIAQEMGANRLSVDGVRSLGNMTAYLAAKTAARPDQMLSFLRTGLGSGGMLGMSHPATLAFGASAIQAGAQGQQAARMLGSMAEDINEFEDRAKEIRKKHTRSEADKLFLRLPSQLGFGSYGQLRQRMENDPDNALFDLLKSFQNIKKPRDRNRAMSALFGAEFARFLANMIESPEILDRSLKLARESKGQAKDTDFLSQTWIEFSKSLEHFIDVVKATWAVLKAEIGDVLKPYFSQFADYLTEWYQQIGTWGIKERFKRLLEGFVEGFLGRPGTFKDLLEQVFGKPGQGSMSSADTFFQFAKGFAEGLKSVVQTISGVFKGLAEAFGIDSADPKAMGKFVAQFMGFTIALHFLRPVLSIFGLVTDFLMLLATIAGLFGGIPLLAIAGGLSALVASILTLKKIYDDPKKAAKDVVATGKAVGPSSETNFIPGWMIALSGFWRAVLDKQKGDTKPEGKKSDESQDKKKKKASVGDATDFSGSRRRRENTMADDLARQLEKLGGTVERTAFISGAGAFRVPGAAGSFASAPGGGSSGTPIDLFNATPGGALPKFGMGRDGIIKRGRVPSLDGRGGSLEGGSGGGAGGATGGYQGGSPDNVGAGKKGSAFLAARREKFRKELEANPELKKRFAALIDLENPGAGTAVAESLFNRMDMMGGTVAKGIGGGSRSFYGPVRRGLVEPRLRELERNPERLKARLKQIDEALAGSNQIDGYTDQGSAGDPNYEAGGTGVNINRERFNHWGGGKWGRLRGHAASKAYREFLKRGIAGEGGNSPLAAFGPEGLPIKGSQALQGGETNPAMFAVANAIKDTIPGGMNRFTAFNDLYHKGTKSKHASGLAGDFTILDPRKSAEAAEAVRNQLRSAGLTDDMFKVIDEYRNPSSNATGGHIHFQFNSEAAAKMYHDFAKQKIDAQKQQAGVTDNVPSIVTPNNSAGNATGGAGGGSNVQIHINGGSHDPEALATLVQRRIDESMNWRLHDVDNQMT